MQSQINKAPIWERAPMFRPFTFFALGVIGFVQFGGYLPSAKLISSISLLFFILFIGLNLWNLRKLNWLNQTLGIFLFLSLGYLSAYYQYSAPPKPELLVKATDKHLAIICAAPTVKNKTIKYEVLVYGEVAKGVTKQFISKGFIYVFKNTNAPLYGIGDTLIVPSNWRHIANMGNPSEFDYKTFCARKNIHLQQFLSPKQLTIWGKRNESQISFLEKTHQAGIQSLQYYIKDSTTFALLKAMLLGSEQDIDPNMRQAYADTGVIHIISISGAHVAILFAAIGVLFKLVRKKENDWPSVVLSLCIIWFYVMLAGASAPALRAAIMFSLLLIGQLFQKETNPLNQLFSAALFLLLLFPMWLFSVGFQLSFLAVLSIILFYPLLLQLYQPKNRISTFLHQAIAASIAAEILVAPLVAFYFHSFPPMFILANIVASITMGAILILGLLLLLVSKIAILGKLIAYILTILSQVFHSSIIALSNINLNFFKTLHLSLAMLLSIYAAITFFYLHTQKPSKPKFYLLLLSVSILSILQLNRAWSIYNQEKIIVYNHGKASSIEYIKGNKYQILEANETESFVAKNTHITLGLSLEHSYQAKNALTINGQKILIMNSEFNCPKQFPIDILIISKWQKKINVAALIASFSPKKIVLSNGQSEYQMKEWAKQCVALDLPIHIVKNEGAFIFPSTKQ